LYVHRRRVCAQVHILIYTYRRRAYAGTPFFSVHDRRQERLSDVVIIITRTCPARRGVSGRRRRVSAGDCDICAQWRRTSITRRRRRRATGGGDRAHVYNIKHYIYIFTCDRVAPKSRLKPVISRTRGRIFRSPSLSVATTTTTTALRIIMCMCI